MISLCLTTNIALVQYTLTDKKHLNPDSMPAFKSKQLHYEIDTWKRGS
jgi:hypothetical protein